MCLYTAVLRSTNYPTVLTVFTLSLRLQLYLCAATGAKMHSFMQLQRHRVMDRLLSHGQVRALVFGAHGEGSPDVHHCIEASAR